MCEDGSDKGIRRLGVSVEILKEKLECILLPLKHAFHEFDLQSRGQLLEEVTLLKVVPRRASDKLFHVVETSLDHLPAQRLAASPPRDIVQVLLHVVALLLDNLIDGVQLLVDEDLVRDSREEQRAHESHEVQVAHLRQPDCVAVVEGFVVAEAHRCDRRRDQVHGLKVALDDTGLLELKQLNALNVLDEVDDDPAAGEVVDA